MTMSRMNDKPAANLHCFYAGTHTATDGKQYTFSEADVADLVASYDPQVARAPMVVGHPKIEDPAYGWAASFSLNGTNVFATPEAVEPQFAQMVNDQRFPNISLSVYLPDSPGNPKPGHFYPRHIGFLGAAPPSLKGMQRAQFAENDGAIEFSMPLPNRIRSLGYYFKRLFQGIRDKAIETDGAEKAEQLIPQWCIDGLAEATTFDDDEIARAAFAAPTPNPENDMTDKTAEFAEQQTKLDAQKTAQDTREAALKKREDDAKREDATDFAEGLVKEGKLLPRQKAPMIELLLSLPAGTVLNFSETGTDGGIEEIQKPADNVLRELLTSLPKQVDFSEKTGREVVLAGEGAAIDFAGPAGAKVDGERLALHNKAVAYQRQHPGTDYMVAVNAVSAGG